MNDQELIARITLLLGKAEFYPEDAVELVKCKVDLLQRKSIKANLTHDRLTKPLECLTKIADAQGVEVNLVILDKETVLPGFKKYIFGYALDSTKPCKGENLVKAFEKILTSDLRGDSIVTVKVAKVKPVLSGALFAVELFGPVSYVPSEGKPNCAKEIIRKAWGAGILDLDQKTALEINKANILKIDLDKKFGVTLSKHLIIKAGQKFGEHGVVYGVVYPVDEVDTDGDSANEDEVMKACWKFMEDYQSLNFMHKDPISPREVSIVECATALSSVPELGIKKGDWYMGIRVREPELKKMIESGEITGFSMEGTALPQGV